MEAPPRQVPPLATAAWAALSATLLALASVYDLAVSERLADPSSDWALWFQNFGEIPGYLSAGVGAAITLATNNPRSANGRLDKLTLLANVWLLLTLTLSVGATLSKLVARIYSATLVGVLGVLTFAYAGNLWHLVQQAVLPDIRWCLHGVAQVGAHARYLHAEPHSSCPADRSVAIVASTRPIIGAVVLVWLGPARAGQGTLGPGSAIHGVARGLPSHGISEWSLVSAV